MNALNEPIAFVDIETTGSTFKDGRVLEIAIIRLEPTGEVRRYSQLLNPREPIPTQITALTGIRPKDVIDMPSFDEVAHEVKEMLDGAVFVAHVVRFDYTFIKAEFKRLEIKFRPKMFCTVKLSSTLYPQERYHNLDSVIARLGLKVENRHRALDDAEVLFELYKHTHRQFGAAKVMDAVKSQFRHQALPTNISIGAINKLPDGPGVYIFEALDGTPLYIGKAIDIRDRVLSHFSADHTHVKELKMAQQVHKIAHIPTNGELGALLLESELIKERQPLYNRMLRRSEYIVPILKDRNKAGYSTAAVSEKKTIETEKLSSILGTFKTKGRAKDALLSLVEEHSLCPKLLGLEKSKGACFKHQLGKCNGACIGAEDTREYNARFDRAFKRLRVQEWPYTGPVIVTESTPGTDGTTGYVFDSWSMVAQLKEYAGEVSVAWTEKVFDTDMYAILKRYMRNPVHRSKIKPLQGGLAALEQL